MILPRNKSVSRHQRKQLLKSENCGKPEWATRYPEDKERLTRVINDLKGFLNTGRNQAIREYCKT